MIMIYSGRKTKEDQQTRCHDHDNEKDHDDRRALKKGSQSERASHEPWNKNVCYPAQYSAVVI